MRFILILLIGMIFSNQSIAQDKVVLSNNEVVLGTIKTFNSKKITIDGNRGGEKILFEDISSIIFENEPTNQEIFKLGFIDGKRMARNKTANFLTGFFLSVPGSVIVHSTSDQYPSYLSRLGPNQDFTNNPDYIRGYTKGAKLKSGTSALTGSILSGIILLLL